MSAGTGRPQEQPSLGVRFAQMFVIMLECREAEHQARISLAEERDFLPSAERMDPGKDASSPHCSLCGLKGSWALAVLPAVRME